MMRRLEIVCLVFGALLLTVCGGEPTTKDDSLQPLAGGGSLDAERQVPSGVDTALELFYEPYDVEFEIEKAVRSGRVTFAVIAVEDDTDSFLSMGWLELDQGNWRPHSFALEPTFPDDVEEGSEDTTLGPIGGSGGQGALAGVVDPNFTRVEVVSSSGELLDADVPSGSGAVIVLLDQTGEEVRLFVGDELVKAIPLQQAGPGSAPS